MLDWGGKENLSKELKIKLEKELYQMQNLPEKIPTHIVIWDLVVQHDASQKQV